MSLAIAVVAHDIGLVLWGLLLPFMTLLVVVLVVGVGVDLLRGLFLTRLSLILLFLL